MHVAAAAGVDVAAVAVADVGCAGSRIVLLKKQARWECHGEDLGLDDLGHQQVGLFEQASR